MRKYLVQLLSLLIMLIVVFVKPVKAVVVKGTLKYPETVDATYIKVGETKDIKVSYSLLKRATINFVAGIEDGEVAKAKPVAVKIFQLEGVKSGTFNVKVTGVKSGTTKIGILLDDEGNPINDSIEIDTKNEIDFTSECVIKVYEIKAEEPYEVPEGFGTKIERDSTLPAGTEKVKRKGVEGITTVTEYYRYVGQEKIDKQPYDIKRVVTKKPVDQIIVRGTKKMTTNLKSLYVEGASIKPAFKTNITEYTFSLTEPADTATIKASPESKDAKVTGTGTITLTKPKHETTVTVTLDGKSTNYKITIVQPPEPPVETPVETPVDEGVKVFYEGIEYKVILPTLSEPGFSEKTLFMDNQEVAVLSNGQGVNVTELEGLGKFLVFDNGEIYSKYYPIVFNGTTYYVLDIEEDARELDQLVYGEFDLGEYTIHGFEFYDPEKSQYRVFYLQTTQGEMTEFLYNTEDQSLIYLRDAQLESPVETPEETTAEKGGMSIQQVIMYGGLVVIGLLLVVLVILVIKRVKEARK